MREKDGGLTQKVASQLLQMAHPDQCVEDPTAIRSAQYVGPRTKGSVALPLPCLRCAHQEWESKLPGKDKQALLSQQCVLCICFFLSDIRG